MYQYAYKVVIKNCKVM